jgi:hypothetical protein
MAAEIVSQSGPHCHAETHLFARLIARPGVLREWVTSEIGPQYRFAEMPQSFWSRRQTGLVADIAKTTVNDLLPTFCLRSTAPSLCPRRPRDETKLERSSDVASDLGNVAVEIKRIGGQIVVSPVQNIAARLQRFRKADCCAGTLIPSLGNEKRPHDPPLNAFTAIMWFYGEGCS